MRKLLLILPVLLLSIYAFAQYSTPGTGVNWDLTDLVDNSGGAVTLETNGQYTISQDITVAASDTVSIMTAEEINMADAIQITVNGVMLCDPQGAGVIFFKAQNDHYLGFRFEDSEGSSFTDTYFKKGGGIKLISSYVEFYGCDFTEFNQENSTGTINLSHSAPLIQGCSFTYNDGPAVMSGANTDSAPQIFECEIKFNVVENGNTPQINLGTSGADSIRIMNCQIIGNPDNDMAGGIAVTTLIGGMAYARIEGNVIRDNRYGITCYGSSVGTLIRDNEIRDNNTQNEPNLGGSGINYYGTETNVSVVTGNIITGNLWGITIQNAAQPNFGQLEGDIINPGTNTFMDNGNNGAVYDLYNNTPNPIMAQNNYWGTDDPDVVEEHIFHQPDDPSLGLVDYLPLYSPPVSINEPGVESNDFISVYPNPASKHVNLNVGKAFTETGLPVEVEICDVSGRVLKSLKLQNGATSQRIALPDNFTGFTIISVRSGELKSATKILVR